MFSCDTLIAVNQCKGNFLAKNSDREPNEPQEIVFQKGGVFDPSVDVVQLTYSSIPQACKTASVLMMKPVWIKGCEMGVNEHGVAGANEALFSRVATIEETNGAVLLTGMDVLRVALERAESAYDAVQVVKAVIEQYGQGGNCGFSHDFRYHNAFIFVDSSSKAFVMMTIGKQWAVQTVSTVDSVSNYIHFQHSDSFEASSDLVEFAIRNGFCKDAQSFSMSSCYSDWILTAFGRGAGRRCRSKFLLNCFDGHICVQSLMSILRLHTADAADAVEDPISGFCKQDICMHTSWGPSRINQTTGSAVFHWAPGTSVPTVWVTGTSTPCLSAFKPVFFDALAQDPSLAPAIFGSTPSQSYVASTDIAFWWQFERFQRRSQHSLSSDVVENMKSAIRRKEAEWIRKLANISDNDRYWKADLMSSAFLWHRALVASVTKQLFEMDPYRETSLLHQMYLRKINQAAGISDDCL
eukprot:ANDGO_04554.mRNA.1 hypothetical protein